MKRVEKNRIETEMKVHLENENPFENCKLRGSYHGKMLVATSAPLGWERVKVSENSGATPVAPVTPVVTSLKYNSN